MPDKTSAPPLRGQLIEIGAGRALRAVFAGPADGPWPLVVLEAGAFGFAADWAAVQDQLARVGLRSMAYDRAGLGFSRPGPEPRDGEAIQDDLERLLRAAGEPGPFLVCGHSMAGLHARLFAARHRGRVVGVVLVDAVTPEAMEFKGFSGMVEQFGHASRLAAWGAGAGLLSPFAGTPLGDAIGLQGAAGVEKRWTFGLASHNHWAAREVSAWPDTARQAREAGPFDRTLPVAVVLAGGRTGPARLREIQTAPAKAATRGWIIDVPGSSHATMLGDEFADRIVTAIRDVLGVTPG